MKRNLPLQYIMIHHSATPRDTTSVRGLINNSLHWLSSLRRNQLKAQGYVADYHYFIDKDGRVTIGQPYNYWSAHSGWDSYNHASLAICIVANLEAEYMTTVQYKALVDLVKKIKKNNKNLKILKHSDVTRTSCTGRTFNWNQFIKEVETYLNNVKCIFRMQGNKKEMVNINGKEYEMPLHLVLVRNRNMIDFRWVMETLIPMIGVESKIGFNIHTKEITVDINE